MTSSLISGTRVFASRCRCRPGQESQARSRASCTDVTRHPQLPRSAQCMVVTISSDPTTAAPHAPPSHGRFSTVSGTAGDDACRYWHAHDETHDRTANAFSILDANTVLLPSFSSSFRLSADVRNADAADVRLYQMNAEMSMTGDSIKLIRKNPDRAHPG
jgi:hypothetical protein